MANNQQQVINRGATFLEPAAKLLRFLHLGNYENVFISQRCIPISTDNIDARLSFIIDMATERYSLPFGVIKNVLANNTLRRNDEAFLAIAYCLRRTNLIPASVTCIMRAQIYNDLPQLLTTDYDMFLFVYLSNKILNDRQQKSGFGRGMKKALFQWYNDRTAFELAKMFGRNRGMHGWTHRDIIHMCHMKFGSQSDKAQVIATLFKRRSATINELSEQAQDSETPEAVDEPRQDPENLEAVKCMIDIHKLKGIRSPEDAAEIIRKHKLNLEHIPAHLLKEPKVWEILMPQVKYRELLRIIPMLQSFDVLKPIDKLSRIMCSVINDRDFIKQCVVHPLEVLAVSKLYVQNARYNEAVKHVWYQKKRIAPLSLRVNPYIVNRFAQAVNNAASNCQQTRYTYFVTLDLRQSAKNKTVLRMRQVTCFEAMVLFALTLKKREKYTQIYTFVDDRNTLRPVHLTVNMTFEQALEYCQLLMMRRTKQSLLLPFLYAEHRNKNTVFITIVDSVARFCQKGEAPINELRAYRQNRTHSKYIVLNLCRSSGDLRFTYEKGLLVICGLAPDTWRLINAFAVNSFP